MNFKSFGQLLQEMLDYLAGSSSALTDVNVGSATRSFLEAVALVLAEVHYLAQQLIGRFFVSTAQGQFLDLRGSEYAIPRVEAAATTRAITVAHGAGQPAVTIPVGWRAGTPPGAPVGVTYQAILQATLPAGAATVAVEAISLTTGAATAIPDNTGLVQVGTPLPGIETITTATIETAGADREADDPYRGRILQFMRSPNGPGSAADYEQEVINAFGAAVGSVHVVPLWAGPGSVLVLILGPNNAPPSAALVADVQAHLDAWAPVGAAVTVEAPTLVPVDVRATVWVAAGWSWTEVQAAAVGAIGAALDGLDIGDDALLSVATDALWHAAGVANYAAVEQRAGADPFAAADIPVGDTGKALTASIALTQGA